MRATLLSFAHGARVNPGVPDFDQRLAALQTQSDRLPPISGGDGTSAEQRLALLTEECAEVVRRWALTSERHARAVTRFEAHLAEWNDAGARLQQDAAQRIDGLERLIQQEWSELRQLHEDPVRQLSEHATSLTQVAIATANAAQQGFERSEARLAAIEGELTRRLTDLTREVHSVAAELRVGHESLTRLPAPAPTEAWPLDGVTRLHHQLRNDAGTAPPALEPTTAVVPAPQQVAGLLPAAATELTGRIESLERALSDRDASLKATTDRSTRSWRFALGALAVVVVVGALLAMRLAGDIRDARERAARAEQAQAAATVEATRQVAAARDDAARQIAAAAQRAERAQIVSEVLAAPDAVIFNMIGRRALTGLSAQMRWSASRGLVFSGPRLPPAPAASTYQLWLLTRGGAWSAGTFAPDASGTVTLALSALSAPQPVIGGLVTIEPEGGRTSPLGEAVFTRLPLSAPPETP